MRRYLVKLAYLSKGVVESFLGEAKRYRAHPMKVYARGHGKTFGSLKSYEEYYGVDENGRKTKNAG